MSRLTRAIRFVRHWHARIGVLAALFFLLLALTGVALNHTDGLGLAKRQVRASWLMHWYGLRGEVPTLGYLFESGFFVGIPQHWVMDGRDIAAAPEPVVGAVELAGIRYLATSSAIHVYQQDGILVERLTGSALPATPIDHIGRAGELLMVQTAQGIFSSEDGLDWKPDADIATDWSGQLPLSDDLRQQIEPLFAPALPLERILLDIHSGRIFGRYGPVVMDLAALVLMALSLSGIWIYLRSLRKRN
jgi:PepSY-associated TM region